MAASLTRSSARVAPRSVMRVPATSAITWSTVAAEDSTARDVRALADSVDRALQQTEESLFQIRLTGRGQDDVRYPMQLAERLGFLFGSITVGDFRPTDAHARVAGELHAQLEAARARVAAVMAGDVERFRALVRSRKLAPGLAM